MFNIGNYVELHYGDPLEGYSLHAKGGDQPIKKHSEIFLVDHAWTTQPDNAHKELLENPKLLERLENLMDIEAEEFEEEESEKEEELEHDDGAVKTVAEQANVSYDRAKEALEAEKYEVVNAIMVKIYKIFISGEMRLCIYVCIGWGDFFSLFSEVILTVNLIIIITIIAFDS